jgi:hypothetical protein
VYIPTRSCNYICSKGAVDEVVGDFGNDESRVLEGT